MKLFVALLCAALAVIFIVQNTAVVEIKFLVWTIALSRALLMFILVVLGVAMGWLLNSALRFRRQRAKMARNP